MMLVRAQITHACSNDRSFPPSITGRQATNTFDAVNLALSLRRLRNYHNSTSMASEQPEETHEGATPLQVLFHAIQSDNAELLQSVLDGSNPPSLVDARNGAGDTVVLASLRAESLEALQLLLDEEVDVDEGNRARDGDRPLHVAVQIKEVESRDWCGVYALLLT